MLSLPDCAERTRLTWEARQVSRGRSRSQCTKAEHDSNERATVVEFEIIQGTELDRTT